MNAVQIRGQMNQLKGGFMERLCLLTGDDLGRINGRVLKLMGRVQVKYGRAKEMACRRMRRISRH